MAIQEIVQQVIKAVTSNPNLLSDLVAHPYSTISKLTGIETVTKEQAAETVTATSALASGQSIDFSTLASVAAKLLSKSDNSVHSLASSLFGGGVQETEEGKPAVSSDVKSQILENLVGVVFDKGEAQASGPKIDLSDGIGLDDLMGLAGKFLK